MGIGLRAFLRGTGEKQGVARDDVNGLVGGLLDLLEQIAQVGIRGQRCESLLDQGGSGVPPLSGCRFDVGPERRDAAATLRAAVIADVFAKLFHAGRAANDVIERFLLPDRVVLKVQSRDGSATLGHFEHFMRSEGFP